MTEENAYDIGVALIVEGGTEKVFYSEFIENRALAHGVSIARAVDGDGINYVATRLVPLCEHSTWARFCEQRPSLLMCWRKP